ncbi:MAG: Gfo/Idh/MocA family oxidoreductase [Ekhidna sp.]|uniref:Gfo/Idh/MocA family protein n=1 Tax=Ekhidna sp. TaxID=2608089 RepID=UPI0032EBF1C9
MNKVRVGLVGCGRIAQRHAGHIQRLGKLAAVCDINAEKARNLGEEFDAPYFTHVADFLKVNDMDVVAVCSPNGLHAEHTIESLKAGFHVLCEKPMALTSADCEEMIKTAERCNRRLFIVKQNRFNPAIEAVKEKLEAGAFGQIYSIQLNCFWNRNFAYYQGSDWKGTKKLDGGTLFTQFSHFIDLLYWLIGDVEETAATIANFAHKDVIEFEDTGVVSLKFKNGVLGTINYTVNAYARNMEGSITIFGEKGTVKVGGQYLNKLDYQSFEGEEIGELKEGNPANEYGEYQGSMSNHDRVYENLIDVLQNGGSIATNGLEGLKTVEIIEKIYKSANG